MSESENFSPKAGKQSESLFCRVHVWGTLSTVSHAVPEGLLLIWTLWTVVTYKPLLLSADRGGGLYAD